MEGWGNVAANESEKERGQEGRLMQTGKEAGGWRGRHALRERDMDARRYGGRFK